MPPQVKNAYGIWKIAALGAPMMAIRRTLFMHRSLLPVSLGSKLKMCAPVAPALASLKQSLLRMIVPQQAHWS